MLPPPQDELVLRFDLYELRLRAGELYKAGHKIKLQDQPFQILAMLLEQPGQIVTREQLRERLWPQDTFVDFDHSLNTAIRKLRQALNDEADRPRFIETLPKRGYRFVGPQPERVAGSPLSAAIESEPNAAENSAASRPYPTTRTALTPASKPRWRIAALVAILLLAFAALGLFLARRNAPLSEKDTVVIADFANSTGDPVFDDTLKQGLAVQLQQSPYLRILPDEKIAETLKLMGRAPGERLIPDIARELCQRAGGAAVIDGSIAKLGDQYVVALNAVHCRTDENLSRDQIVSRDKSHVLAAVDTAAQRLRGKLGESRNSIHQYDTPIEQATTPSLDALKALSLANKTLQQSGEVAAIPLFKRAIELDPKFALAYAELGGIYLALGEPEESAETIQKAYELREHVSEVEKFHITAFYYTGVTGDLEKARQVCETWARAYPRDDIPHRLLGLIHEYLGQNESAIAEDREAMRLNPDFAVAYSNLMEVYTPLNRLQDAQATYQKALDLKLDGTYLHTDRYVVAFLENDAPEMQRQIALARSMPGQEDWLFSLQSDTQAYSGHLQSARELSQQAVESAKRNNLLEVAAMWRMNAAVREAEFGNPAQARVAIQEGLQLANTRDSQVIAALVLARAADAARAQTIADTLEKRFPENVELISYWLPSVRAAIALERGKPAEAINILEPVLPYDLAYPRPQLAGGAMMYPVYLRGLAYLSLHQGAAAAAEFQKFLDYRTVVVNCPLGALARMQLGRAHAQAANPAAARAAYQAFLSAWKDADPNIPILSQANSEYAKLK